MDESTRRHVTAKLTEACIHHLVKRRQAVFREMGLIKWGRLRADVLAIDLSGTVTVVEVKSCWQDFKRDQKLAQYRQHCDWLYICVAHGLYSSMQGRLIRDWCTENRCGVMVLDPESGYVQIRHKARLQLTLSQEDRFLLVCRLAWRAGDANKRLVKRRRRIFI